MAVEFIEEEGEGEVKQVLTRQLWSVTNVIILDIFSMNIPHGIKKATIQSLMRKMKCF